MNASFTRMFVAMTSGSSHIDSTKNTWQRKLIIRNSKSIWKIYYHSSNHQCISHLVSVVLRKIKDEFPPLSGGVSGIKNLTDNTGLFRPNQIAINIHEQQIQIQFFVSLQRSGLPRHSDRPWHPPLPPRHTVCGNIMRKLIRKSKKCCKICSTIC